MSVLAIVLAAAASANGVDLSAEAEERMGLSFDLDALEGKLRAKRAPAAAPPAADPYGYADVPPPLPAPVVRLPLEPNSLLESVTVHRDRALVTRSRRVALAAGTHTLTFEGLPWDLVEDGLAASLREGDARIVSVEVLSGAGEVDETERIASVRTEVEELVADLGVVRDRIEALLAERVYLRQALVPDGATAGQPVAQVEQGLAFVARAETRIAKELREQEERAEELDEALAPLLVKLEDPLATGRPVRVDLDVARAGDVEVALRYAVVGAGWTPSYSARLNKGTGRIELEVYGVVTQSTQEDWTDAGIALSTADPTGRGSVPDLVPWTLGRSGGAGVYGALDLGTGATSAGAPPPAGSGGVVDSRLSARVEGSGAVVLAIPGKRTIRGDGSPQRLPVGVQELESDIALASIPKVALEVQRRATVHYDGELPLLPGPVSAFVGADYVGSGQIQAIVPGETLELAFGSDDRFRVTRMLVTRTQERAGRKTTRYTFRFRTTVANHGDRTETVTVTDQLPLSEVDRIEVDVVDLSGGTARPEDGLVEWTLTVPAGGETSFELAFEVTVPDEFSYVATDLELMY